MGVRIGEVNGVACAHRLFKGHYSDSVLLSKSASLTNRLQITL